MTVTDPLYLSAIGRISKLCALIEPFIDRYKKLPEITIQGDTLKVSLLTDTRATVYGFEAKVY